MTLMRLVTLLRHLVLPVYIKFSQFVEICMASFALTHSYFPGQFIRILDMAEEFLEHWPRVVPILFENLLDIRKEHLNFLLNQL